MSKHLTASVSIDLDDKWTYLKTCGDQAWRSYPSYLGIVVPRILSVLETHGIKATFFVVGKDATQQENAAIFRQIVHAGHEIASHSFHHDPWLQAYSEGELDRELESAEEAIIAATGQQPVGFRGPGFSQSDTLIDALAKRNYLYDATTFPNILNPLARRYFLKHSALTRSERRQRGELFGSFRDGFRTNRPHNRHTPHGSLTEIPVTTLPFLKTPVHLSYVLYLSEKSTRLALDYFKTALYLCKKLELHYTLLLHPLDFVGIEDNQGLLFFPGMKMTLRKKQRVVSQVLLLLREFKLLTLHQFALQFKKNTSAEASTNGSKQ